MNLVYSLFIDSAAMCISLMTFILSQQVIDVLNN